jgi:catechol 2,3-dioxygenase-like lactoylglutathione lyase family enzyme
MNHCLIRRVRHVGLAVRDLPTAVGFYHDVWGLTPAEVGGDAVFLAAEGSPEPYVLRLRRAETERVDLIALAVDDTAAVEAMAERLIAAGVRVAVEPRALSTPGAGYGLRFFDPDGRTLEVSAGVTRRPYREIKETETLPVDLSHVVVNSPDMPRAVRFFTGVLGFRVSDYLEDKMTFLRCADPHHAIAVAAGPHASLNHVAYETRGLDEFMRATGKLIRAGHPLMWGPGRHGPGNNTFSYFLGPGRFIAEFTTELERVCDEEAWRPRVYRSVPEEADLWGTANARPGEPFLGAPDPGSWTLPPW